MRWPLLIGMLVLLGLALRVYKAWTLYAAPDSDHGIVYLMAKHMAEGRDFPVFFYGQPYMGSLEPAVSALVCRVFGVTAFNVCLGTVLMGLALLPLIYLWGRDAGGRRTGLVALLLSLVGTNTNFHFSVAPRGGYMAMMVCGVGTVYLACRIVTRMKAGQPVRMGSYLLLGFLAGLGWWSNQLVAAFLLAAIVILLAGVSWRLIREGTLPGLLAFFAGSAPWWLWNARHDWSTFDFGEALGRLPPGKGLVAFGTAFLKVTDLMPPRPAWGTVVLCLMGAMVVWYLVWLVRDAVARSAPERLYFRLAAPVTLLSLAAVSMTSKYLDGGGAGRYLVPLLPALAVMLGWSAAWLMERRLAWLGWLLAAAVLPAHLYALPGLMDDHEYGRRAQERVEPLVTALMPLCDGACFGDYGLHWLNFASRERLCVATLPWERYAPYGLRVELADHPALLDDYGSFSSFLAYAGGSSRETNVAGVHIDYDLKPPSDDWRYCDDQVVSAIRDDQGVSRLKALTDGTMNTAWTRVLKRQETAGLEVEFRSARALCGIRFISVSGEPPGNVQIEVRASGRTNWVVALPWTRPGGFFWSGSRLKWDGLQTYEELRFTVPAGGVDRLRLKLGLADSRPRTFNIDEILFMESDATEARQEPMVAECLTLLKQEGVVQFRGPRWITERLAVSETGGVNVLKPSFVTRSIQALPGVDSSRADKLTFRERTGLLMDFRDAPRTRVVLAQFGHRWEERKLGSLILMVVAAATTEHDGLLLAPAYWTEQGLFAEEPCRTMKQRSERVYRQAVGELERGQTNAAVSTLSRALAYYEGHQPARRALADALRSAGLTNEAAFQEGILSTQTHPRVKGEALFPCGIQLLGLTLSTNVVAPGQSFDITYFWTCPPTLPARRYAAFVNFQSRAERFQDDHVLLEDLVADNLAYQPFPEVYSYTHRIGVPAMANPGEYAVVMGVVDRITTRRLKPVTTLTVRKQGVHLPATVTITGRSDR